MVYSLVDTSVPELSFSDWFSAFQKLWNQGEHVALVGKTGVGKTSLARDILSARDYVIALALKRKDDTLASFPRANPPFKILHYRPKLGLTIPYNVPRVVVTVRPNSLRDTSQAERVYRVLDKVFQDGGWCLYCDDTGYITGTLGLKRALVVLLSQARSSGVSMVTAMVQPASVTQGVPTEALRQIRHLMVWRYNDLPSIESIAKIAGCDKKLLASYMSLLDSHDFLYLHDGDLTIVRNTRR